MQLWMIKRREESIEENEPVIVLITISLLVQLVMQTEIVLEFIDIKKTILRQMWI